MIVIAFAALLYVVAAGMIIAAGRRDRALVGEGLKDAWGQFLAIMPALTVGIMGAGFIAAMVPPELAQTYLGEGSGITGYAIAYAIGAFLPGGPVVGFALGAAALQAGASIPLVVVFVTAWALVSLHRLLVWELAAMPRRVTLARFIVSAPVPVLLGLVTELLV